MPNASDATATAAASDDAAPGFPEPNPSEAMFFYHMIKNMKGGQMDIDWDGVAQDSSFKNAAVAKKRFYQIKLKLGLDGGKNSSGSNGAAGAAAANGNGNGNGASSPAKPTKSPRKPRAARGGGAADGTADGATADGSPSPAKVTKRGRKVGAAASAAKTPKNGKKAKSESNGDADTKMEEDDGAEGEEEEAAAKEAIEVKHGEQPVKAEQAGEEEGGMHNYDADLGI